VALPPPKPQTSIQIELPADLQPVYTNLARIAHAPAEFVLDFARFLPGDTKAVVATRLIMSPVALKLFAHALNENLSRFETNFGTINIPGGTSSLADSLFKSHHTPGEPGEPPAGAPDEPPEKPEK
jgi:hypothetical protein